MKVQDVLSVHCIKSKYLTDDKCGAYLLENRELPIALFEDLVDCPDFKRLVIFKQEERIDDMLVKYMVMVDVKRKEKQ